MLSGPAMTVLRQAVACCAVAAGLVAVAGERPKGSTKAQEAAAERVFAEASRLFQRQQLFELKAVLERLRKAHPDSAAVTDTQRQPSFADMLKAVEGLGKFLVVRRDGAAGACRKIQEAIDAATPNSTIEIQDDGPYHEKLVIPQDKPRLTLRGKKTLWPVIVAVGEGGAALTTGAAETTVEHLVLAHQGAGGAALAVQRGPCQLRSVVLGAKGPPPSLALVTAAGATCELQSCIIAGNATLEGDATLEDCLWPRCDEEGLAAKGAFKAENSLLCHVVTTGPAELRGSTVAQGAMFKGKPSLALDCILYKVAAASDQARIEHCNVYPGGFLAAAVPGAKCFTADPRFMNPRDLDYRLNPNSPCRKRGSEGGDLGCRYTTEIVELMKKAVELRNRRLLIF